MRPRLTEWCADMNRPCPNKLQCGCVDGSFESPLANLSSEAPDSEVFTALHFGGRITNGGERWSTDGCVSVCTSTVSQEEADLCAEAQTQQCLIPQDPPEDPPDQPDPPGPPNPPGEPPTPTLFCNDAVTCGTAPCDGTIPACAVLATSKADANAIAASICSYNAYLCNRNQPPGPPDPPVPPVTLCPTITGYGQVSPINADEGDDVVLSVTYSYFGDGTLIFVWYLDGIPLATTPDATLVLDGLTDTDAGTYVLRIFTTGCAPAVSNDIVLNVEPAAFPEAYWTLDEGSGDREDSVNGVLLSPLESTVSAVAGIISNGAQFAPLDAALNNFPRIAGGGDGLQYSGNGFSVAGWFKCTQYDFGSGSFLFQDNVSTVPVSTINLILSGNTIEIQADLEGASYQAFPISDAFVPTLGVWYFFAMTYDGADGSWHLSINDGAVTDGSSSYVLSPVNNGPGFVMGTAGYLGGAGTILVMDEVGVFPFRLAANQITYLYNGGAGQTWPLSLPDPIP